MPTDDSSKDSLGEQPKEKLRPTIINIPDKRQRLKETPPPSEVPTSQGGQRLQPTAIPGVEVKKLEVRQDELRKLFPGYSPIIYQKAVELLRVFVVSKANERKAILWGHELQKSYSDLVTQTLTLSQSPVLTRVQGFLNRMMDILGSIDLLVVCGYESGKMFQRLTRTMNTRIDTIDELAQAQKELGQLVEYMDKLLVELLDLKGKLEQNAQRFNEYAEEIEASALAADFLADYLQANASLAKRYTDRSMSLTQTLAQIRQNDTVQKIQIEQPVEMINAIQNVVLVMMPGVIGNLASVVTLSRSSITKAEAMEYSARLQDSINQLK